ncbi:putative non-specific serine/threonine protein kinase [Helianthus annuus]|nr:putative non-specific serine/threonine protein kinase [Helianthus annuus]
MTGRRIGGSERTEDAGTISEWAWENWMEGRGVELIDPSMRDTCNPLQAMKRVNVGLLCVQEIMDERLIMLEERGERKRERKRRIRSGMRLGPHAKRHVSNFY